MTRSKFYCLADEAGSPSRSSKEPFRVGFLMTCRPERLQEDIRRLKYERPPRSKSGEYHAREDDPATRGMLRAMLCLNPEPLMYIVEWRKDTFPDSAFRNGRLHPLADANALITSFAVTSADIAVAASARAFAQIEIIVEASLTDIASNHRGNAQTLQQTLPIMLEKHAKLRPGRPGTMSAIRLSTKRKQECPILSFVDHWLWAYARYHDRGDRMAFPEVLQARTEVHIMTPAAFEASQAASNADR